MGVFLLFLLKVGILGWVIHSSVGEVTAVQS